MKRIFRTATVAGIGFLVGFGSLLATGNQRAQACATLDDDDTPVRVASEQAVIVWDAQKHIEHFIRQANFVTDAKNFAFIVPSPSTPQLEQADSAAFDDLTRLLEPLHYRTTITGVRYTSLLFPQGQKDSDDAPSGNSAGAGTPGTPPGDPAVTITGQQRVAGLDATSLRATDATSLNRWLNGHGYPVSAKLNNWIAPYVAKHWVVTAFRIAKTSSTQQISSPLVRMTFHTEQPFYPYREPPSGQATNANTPSEDRDLRVFVVSNGRMRGDIGGARGAGWPGIVNWAGELPSGNLARQVSLTSADFPAKPWLTIFDDRSSPRHGTDDVWFSPSAQPQAVTPPPQDTISDYRIPIPVELVVFLVGYLGIGGWYARRRRLRNV